MIAQLLTLAALVVTLPCLFCMVFADVWIGRD